MIAYLPSFRKPLIVDARDEKRQTEFIIEEIIKQREQGISYDEIAILVRANYLTKSIELGLKRAKIPYKVLCGISFFERKHIRDLIAFLKYLNNPKNEIAFSRIANLFDGIGPKTVEKLYAALKEVNHDINVIDLSKLPFKVNKNAKKKD